MKPNETSPNEKLFLNAAEHIQAVGQGIRQVFEMYDEKLRAANEKAQSPEASEPEDLTQESQMLETALAGLDTIVSQFRAAATSAGNSQSQGQQATSSPPTGIDAQPASPQTGTPETGPAGIPTKPLDAGQTLQTTVGGETEMPGEKEGNTDKGKDGVILADSADQQGSAGGQGTTSDTITGGQPGGASIEGQEQAAIDDAFEGNPTGEEGRGE